MAYTFIQQNSADNATSATTITVTLTPTAGNLLVFAVAGDSADTTSITLSDNLGSHNTFSQIGTDLVTASAQRCAWWFAANCKGGATTFTATYSASTRFRQIYVAEYSGIATSPFLNGARAENNSPGTGTDAISSTNANATSQPALVWGFSIDTDGNGASNAGTGYTSRTSVWSSATGFGRPEDKRVTVTGNVAATFTATVGTDDHATGVGIFAEAVPAVPALSWASIFPDRASMRPPVSASVAGAAAPVFTPTAPAVPALSWVSVFPDRARLVTGAAIVGGPAQPEATIPNGSAPPLSWSPGFPDLARRARATAIVGGVSAPEAALPNPPAPPLSWSPGFSDSAHARLPQLASGAAAPALPIPNPPPTIFPLSSGGRYLVKNDGTPFLVKGDTTWELGTNIPLASINSFLNTITSQGFNSVSMEVIEHHYTVVKPPKERGGNLPFTKRLDGAAYTGSPNGTTSSNGTQGQFAADNYSNINTQAPDPTFINNTYWQAVETILNACVAHNVAVFVWPFYLGFHAGDEGWMQELVAWDAVIGAGGFTGFSFANSSKSKAWNYGAWLADRWKAYGNLIWVAGGDYGSGSQTLDTTQKAAVESVISGMKSVSGQQSVLWTAHWDRISIATDTALASVTFDINGSYCGEEVAETTRRAYAHSPVSPAMVIEYFYEDDLFGGSVPYRKYMYWAFIGGIGGGLFGNEQIWRFDDGTPGTDWQTLLTTQATLDASRQFAFWDARPWWRLKPSGLGGMGTIVTAGGGTASPQSTDYVAAAATSEGDLLLAYVPPAHTGSITIDMTKLGALVTARWFDPTNASFTAIGTFANTGTHAFTPPATNSAGDTDFLLVLDAPGTPMPLSWGPQFPDQAQRRSLSTAQMMPSIVQPVAPPPPPPPLSWVSEPPDEALRVRSAVNVGGEAAPISQIGSPSSLLSWTAEQVDVAQRQQRSADVVGVTAPPSQIGSPSVLHSWTTTKIDASHRSLRAADVGGETAPLPPPLDTRLLAWVPPSADVFAHRVAQSAGEVAPVLAPSPIPSAASWLPGAADAARRSLRAGIGGSVQPEIALSNIAAPVLSWSPSFPDFALRARQSANVGGQFMPEEALPNPPAPPLSWLPGFPDGQLIRSRWTASVSDASMVTVIELSARPPYQIMQPRAGIGRAGIRREVVSRAGVSRTGSVRLSLPSPTGEWNPQLDDNVVDFDRDAFTRFISDKGYDITWEKAVLCPNVSGTGLSPRDHAIGCPVCGGAGYVYVDAIATKMLMQGIRMNQSFFAYGRWDVGNMLVTAEPEFTIDYFDRLTLGNGVGRYTQRLVRQPGVIMDRLKYAPLCFHYVAWVDRSTTLVPFVADVDFRISADGSSIEWFGASQPDAGSFYSVCYDYRPRYVVLDLVHHHRDSTIDGQHYAFPVQAVAKLDFLIRNEGQDARQVLDTNPFQ